MSEAIAASPSGVSVRLNAQVQGLGPFFQLKLEVMNGGAVPLRNVRLALAYDHELYRIPRATMVAPLLLPSLVFNSALEVECLDENAPPGSIRVLVLNSESPVPHFSAIVNMPQSELLE